MGRGRNELRAVAKRGAEYALVAYLTLDAQGHIYSGSEIAMPRDPMKSQRFRQSYHRDGNVIRRIRGFNELAARGDRTSSLTELIKLGGTSARSTELVFERHLKAETATRKYLMINIETLGVPTFTIDFFAFRPDHLAQFEAELSLRRDQMKLQIIGTLRADWCEPNLGLIAWSLTKAQFESFPGAPPQK